MATSQTDLTTTGASAGGANIAAGLSLPPVGEIEVKARGYWEQVWRRFRRDRIAIGGGAVIVLLFLISFVLAPIMASILGHGPNEIFSSNGGLDSSELPWGPWHH